jgi:hypothetical protein
MLSDLIRNENGVENLREFIHNEYGHVRVA